MSRRFTPGQQAKCAERIRFQSGGLEMGTVVDSPWVLKKRKEETNPQFDVNDQIVNDLYRKVEDAYMNGEAPGSSLSMIHLAREKLQLSLPDAKLVTQKMLEVYRDKLISIMKYKKIEGKLEYFLTDKGREESIEFGRAK
ncbi:MAG: hypothetical protein WC548_02080 [Candidatus Pacearchaeota archaeon]